MGGAQHPCHVLLQRCCPASPTCVVSATHHLAGNVSAPSSVSTTFALSAPSSVSTTFALSESASVHVRRTAHRRHRGWELGILCVLPLLQCLLSTLRQLAIATQQQQWHEDKYGQMAYSIRHELLRF